MNRSISGRYRPTRDTTLQLELLRFHRSYCGSTGAATFQQKELLRFNKRSRYGFRPGFLIPGTQDGRPSSPHAFKAADATHLSGVDRSRGGGRHVTSHLRAAPVSRRATGKNRHFDPLPGKGWFRRNHIRFQLSPCRGVCWCIECKSDGSATL